VPDPIAAAPPAVAPVAAAISNNEAGSRQSLFRSDGDFQKYRVLCKCICILLLLWMHLPFILWLIFFFLSARVSLLRRDGGF
jgi:hypothetical protein